MYNLSFTKNFLNISPDNEALKFLSKRLNGDDYRGRHLSQHNRFDMDKVHKILKLLNEFAPNKTFMQIRTTDISKRPEPEESERKYVNFCQQVKEQLRIGTEDAMRKNLFPDFHRMGLIKRFGKNKREIDPYARKPVKFVTLTDLGIKLINSSMKDRYFIYSKGLNRLLNGMVETLLMMLRNDKFNLKKVEIHEYLFFITAIQTSTKFSIGVEYAVNLIQKYRLLTPNQRKTVIDTLTSDLKPNKAYPKNERRDYHNWHNETQQIYTLLGQTIYFDVNRNSLILAMDEKCEHSETGKLLRSSSEKIKYFTEHKVGKKSGFELHHVIPVSNSESYEHFKLIDNWKNMTYIDGFNHARIGQNKNRNIIMESQGEDLMLMDYFNDQIYLKNNINILYSVDHQPMMLNYNKELREG